MKKPIEFSVYNIEINPEKDFLTVRLARGKGMLSNWVHMEYKIDKESQELVNKLLAWVQKQ